MSQRSSLQRTHLSQQPQISHHPSCGQQKTRTTGLVEWNDSSAKRDIQNGATRGRHAADRRSQIENRSEESMKSTRIVDEGAISSVFTWTTFKAKMQPVVGAADRHALLMKWIAVSDERFRTNDGKRMVEKRKRRV
ncbi:hypothetical protein DOTSEDRAFT_35276 [Dothistroma septosporum NZE10]|uniref:Uncharacterized protein n=1 Tax=Dothistroma septosporum (strain NZE10 / CBS 128990) TaxID=675120 RepID=M2Y3N6_DOTSN|nr:hypothetical protein DOTSEDRAFT_35276 [Dothistroma septosporum NZE10]